MLRVLVILGLVLYILYKIGSFFFRAGAAAQQLRNQQRQDGNINAGMNNKQTQKKTRINGGEYIDYEEVK